MNATKTIEPIDRRYQLVMFWGGLRGALALALALSLPHDFGPKRLILVCSMGVVLATLLVNALTIQRLLHALGLDRLSPAELFARFESLLVAKRETRDHLVKFADERALHPRVVERIENEYITAESRMEAERKTSLVHEQLTEQDHIQILAMQALHAEKRHYWEEFSEGHLTENAYKEVVRDADRSADYLKAFGRLPGIQSADRRIREREWDRWLYRMGIFSKRLQMWKAGRIADHLEENGAKAVAARSVLELLDRLWSNRSIEEKPYLVVRQFYSDRKDMAQRALTRMAADYPEYVERTQELLLMRSCLHSEERSLDLLRELGIVPDKVYFECRDEIRSKIELLRRRPVESLQLEPSALLAQIPLFQLCAPEELLRIAALLETETFTEGDTLVRQGESGESMYVVARGAVLVLRDDADRKTALQAMLVAGDFFGEIALLADSRRTATVRAATACTLLRLRRSNLQSLMDHSPAIRESIHRAYRARTTASR